MLRFLCTSRIFWWSFSPPALSSWISHKSHSFCSIKLYISAVNSLKARSELLQRLWAGFVATVDRHHCSTDFKNTNERLILKKKCFIYFKDKVCTSPLLNNGIINHRKTHKLRKALIIRIWCSNLYSCI